jgi:hypothetical protein
LLYSALDIRVPDIADMPEVVDRAELAGKLGMNILGISVVEGRA